MSSKTFLGGPCKRGHHDLHGKCLRFLSNGACVQCTAEAKARARTAAKQRAIAERPMSYGGSD